MRFGTSLVLGLVVVLRCSATTLESYALAHPLVIRSVKRGESIDLGDGNQTNNLKEGGNVLLLSGKNLTSLDGISRLVVSLAGEPTPISKVEGLQLFLNRDELTSVPDEISTLSHVTFIYLFYNHLSSVPLAITRMQGLQGLYLTGNDIGDIRPEVFAMKGLRKLQVSKNHLREVPAAIGSLVNLIHMNLSENEITSLPDSIGNLRKLRVCDLSDNQLSELPERFGEVKILYQLRVRNNPLHTLPAGFAKMPGTIDITGTKIRAEDLSPELRAKLGTEKPAMEPSSGSKRLKSARSGANVGTLTFPMKTDPRVDAYIAKSAKFARPILSHLRKIIGKACPEVQEAMKWSTPFFEYKGNLCILAAFKAHCSFGFWHCEMAPLVEKAFGPINNSRGQFGRITKLGDLPKDAVLIGLIKAAMKINESGTPSRITPKGKKKPEAVVPADLAAALKKDKKAAEAFKNFSPSHRREYVEWITEAKREETRQKRVATTIEWLAQGKARNWKYETC